jgi:hypothetical protein
MANRAHRGDHGGDIDSKRAEERATLARGTFPPDDLIALLEEISIYIAFSAVQFPQGGLYFISGTQPRIPVVCQVKEAALGAKPTPRADAEPCFDPGPVVYIQKLPDFTCIYRLLKLVTHFSGSPLEYRFKTMHIRKSSAPSSTTVAGTGAGVVKLPEHCFPSGPALSINGATLSGRS